MEADRAAIGIENWRGEQMVEIDEIGCGDDKASKFPAHTPDYRSDQKRRDPMPAIMQEGLEGL
jgi:hypothetical protein